jgi:uncharacterized Zn-binding protein involved in type VI secretion
MAGRLAARQGDHIVAVDLHKQGDSVVPAPYRGELREALEPGIRVNGRAAARLGSGSVRGHTMRYNCGTDTGIGTVTGGSAKVYLNGKPAARDGDSALTCTLGGHPTPPRVSVSGGNVWVS